MASRSWNRVELIGNLTRDPELRYTPNGAAVCTFGLATNRTFVSEGERREEADFHKLVAWNKLAELCNQLLKKGIRVFISGRLQTRSWEAQDGQTRQVTEIVVEDMIVLSPKSDGSGPHLDENVDNADTVPAKDEIPDRVVEESPKVSEPGDDTQEKKAEPAKAEKAAAKTPSEEVGDDDLPF